jgi:hypothetical protein
MVRPLVAVALATTFATLAHAQAAPSRAPKPDRESAAGADLQQELTSLRQELRELRRALDQLQREQGGQAPERLRARALVPTPTAEPRKAERVEKTEKVETVEQAEPKVRTRTFTFNSDSDGKWVEVAPKDGQTNPLRAVYRTGDGKPMVLRTDGTTINLAPGAYKVETGGDGETRVFTIDGGSGKVLKAKAKAQAPATTGDGKCSCGCDCDCCKPNTTSNKRTIVSMPQSLFAPGAVALRAGTPLLGTTSGVLAPSTTGNFTLVAPDRNCSPARARLFTPLTAPVPPTPPTPAQAPSAPKAPKAPKPPKAPKVKDADKSKLISV